MSTAQSGASGGVVIYAKDLHRVAGFYADVVGIDVVERTTDYIVMSGAAGEVSIVAMPPEIADSVTVSSPPSPRDETPIKPLFLVRSLAHVVDCAPAHGGGTRPPSEAWDFRGTRRLDGYDPEGNVIQFVEMVAR